MRAKKMLIVLFFMELIISSISRNSCTVSIEHQPEIHTVTYLDDEYNIDVQPWFYDYDDHTFLAHVICDRIVLSVKKSLVQHASEFMFMDYNLKLLEIKNSFFPILNASLFEGFYNCTILIITSSNVSIFDSYFMNNFINLEELNLAHNDIETIQPNTFVACNKLRMLDLSYNKLTSLKNIPKINNLKILYTQFNKIKSLEGISELSTLNILNVSHNVNLIVTEDINRLKSLNEFDISFTNAIKVTDCSKFRLFLSLRYNNLHLICKNFSQSIKHIDYGHNLISDINNDTFKGLIKLKILILVDNFIKEIRYDMFNDLKKLEILDLQQNYIGCIPKGCFRHLNKLVVLKLARNRLKSIEYGTFSGLVSLSYLDLTSNRIYNFDANLIYPLSSLNNLYLEGNMLDNLDVDTFFQHLNNLDSLSFSFANVGCDHLIGIITAFYNKGVIVEKGSTKHKDNVNGISCNPDIKNATRTLEEIRLNNTLSAMSRIYAITMVICITFVLIVISIIVVKCLYLSRNGNCWGRRGKMYVRSIKTV